MVKIVSLFFFFYYYLLGAPRLESYPMSRAPRGLCLIINNLEFHKESMNRPGGEVDEKMLYDLFSKLSFEVHVKNDLKYSEILELAEEYALRDHSDFDAFVMIVMSHGEDGDTIYGVGGKHKVRVKDLMAEFTVNQCPSLQGKPKIFIFQACRGSLDEREAPISDNNGYVADAMASDSTLALSVTPPGADFLLAFATTPGYVSWRSEESGSVYIKVSMKVLMLFVLSPISGRITKRTKTLNSGAFLSHDQLPLTVILVLCSFPHFATLTYWSQLSIEKPSQQTTTTLEEAEAPRACLGQVQFPLGQVTFFPFLTCPKGKNPGKVSAD